MKSQAAMEYLMTYGWAILVIAVVLAALYSLGIFNPNTFAPKASAGSCEVVRPFGPSTTTDIHLEGTCTNMLPKYVASFNGKNSDITSLSNITLDSSNATGEVTASVWVNVPVLPGNEIIDDEGAGRLQIFLYNGAQDFGATPFGPWIVDPKKQLSTNTWYMLSVTATFNSIAATSTDVLYLDGKVVNSAIFTGADPILPHPISIGNIRPPTCYYCTKGEIANVQIYNTSLSANQISALYQEGIGGDPIELTYLTGWWPLNGNANDYSGNKNNGKEYNVSYSSTWYRTYSAP